MKAAFALNLSHDGIGLLRRTSRGWLSIGEVSLDDPDLSEQLSYLRKTALALSPAGLGCKLVIPNSQILYTELEAPGPDEAARRAQIARGLEGMTPYPVADLVFDWRARGPVVQVAVVARETLAEAEAFAEDFRFAPLCFVAMPEAGTFDGEPFFGLAQNAAAHLPAGETLERDAAPVRIIGRGEPAPDPWPVPTAAAETAPKGDEAEAGIAEAAAPLPPAETARGPAASPAPESPSPPAPATAPEPKATTPSPAERPAAPPPKTAPPPAAPPPKAPGKPRGKAPAATGAAPVLADRRPAPPPAEIGGFTGLGARIAERRASVLASRRLLPLAGVALALVLALLIWGGMAAFLGDGGEDPAPAGAGLAVAPDPVATAAPTEADGSAEPATEAAEAEAPAAEVETPPSVSFTPPAQPVAVAEVEPAVPLRAEAAPGATAAPEPAPAAAAEAAPAAQADPPPPAPPPAPVDKDPVDPEQRYALTGVWTLAPDIPGAPAPDRSDAGLAAARDLPPAPAPPPDALAGLDPTAEPAPGARPDPPPFAPPPRRDAQGRIVPTPEGVVTAEGVTLVAGRPPLAAPPRPEGLVPVAAAPAEAELPEPAAAPAPGPADAGTIEPAADAEAPEPTTVPVAPAPADAIRPPPRPAALAVEEDARAPADPAPGPAPDAGTDPAPVEQAALPPGDPALAGARPRAPSAAVLQRSEAAAAERAEAAGQAAELQAQLAAASPLAVASSRRPAARPRDFSDAISAALALAVAEPAAAAAPTPPAPDLPEDDGEPEVRAALPDIPTTAAVSREATVSRAIRLNEMNLIGVFGTPGARRALVRMPNGRFQRVEVGDRLDGGRVAAIGETELSYVKNGRTIVLALPRG